MVPKGTVTKENKKKKGKKEFHPTYDMTSFPKLKLQTKRVVETPTLSPKSQKIPNSRHIKKPGPSNGPPSHENTDRLLKKAWENTGGRKEHQRKKKFLLFVV